MIEPITEMISKTKGRPRNSLVEDFKHSTAGRYLLGGESRTDRSLVNLAYRQQGQGFLQRGGLLFDFLGPGFGNGSAPDPKGWRTFLTEVGRWSERFSDTAEVLRRMVDDDDSLTQKVRRLKRARLGEKEMTAEPVEVKALALAGAIQKQFPKLTYRGIAEGFRRAAAVLDLCQEHD